MDQELQERLDKIEAKMDEIKHFLEKKIEARTATVGETYTAVNRVIDLIMGLKPELFRRTNKY